MFLTQKSNIFADVLSVSLICPYKKSQALSTR